MKKMSRETIGSLALLAGVSTTTFSDTLWVPDDYPRIQEAIEAAEDGDEVVVRPGTYFENLFFSGKAITVRSELGRALTTINGRKTGSAAWFGMGEGPDTVLRGFTLTNGSGTFDGYWGDRGGAIYCFYASPTIADNTIVGNTAEDGEGGGIWCYASAAVITGNRIRGNAAGLRGGGIACYGGSALTVTGNVIRGNTARDGGGVDWGLGSSGTLGNNLILENQAERGGGISCHSSSPTVLGNTILANAAQDGGGIHSAGSYCHPVVGNTILWNNVATGAGPELWTGDGIYESFFTIRYCDVKGGVASVHVDTGTTLSWGPGMIDADPLFADPPRSDFRLRQDPPQAGVVNPCVDAGDPSAPLDPGSTRTDWVPDAGIVDLGYHYAIPRAAAAFRNGGTNPASYEALTLPVLGTTYAASVDLGGTTGHAFAWLVGHAAPAHTVLGGGQTILVDADDAHGELLGTAIASGPLASFDVPVPPEPALAGFAAFTQALHFGGVRPFALSNAQDLVLGY